MTGWWEAPRDTPGGGWCGGWKRDPHYADDLVTASAPVPVCRTCWSAWNRDDTSEVSR